MFRIFKYDLTKCGDDLNTISGQGLLAMRHRVKEGMFLVSILIHCTHTYTHSLTHSLSLSIRYSWVTSSLVAIPVSMGMVQQRGTS